MLSPKEAREHYGEQSHASAAKFMRVGGAEFPNVGSAAGYNWLYFSTSSD